MHLGNIAGLPATVRGVNMIGQIRNYPAKRNGMFAENETRPCAGGRLHLDHLVSNFHRF